MENICGTINYYPGCLFLTGNLHNWVHVADALMEINARAMTRPKNSTVEIRPSLSQKTTWFFDVEAVTSNWNIININIKGSEPFIFIYSKAVFNYGSFTGVLWFCFI